jgi:hypothetical protein
MEIPFADYCATVQQQIGQVYGLLVVTRDIPDPLTGDLDGIEIQIDYAVTSEQRLFLLAHLFGHTVQWNVDPKAFELGRQYRPPVAEELFPEIITYELEAARYGLFCCTSREFVIWTPGFRRTPLAIRPTYCTFIARAKRKNSGISGRSTPRCWSPNPFHSSSLRSGPSAWMASSSREMAAKAAGFNRLCDSGLNIQR